MARCFIINSIRVPATSGQVGTRHTPLNSVEILIVSTHPICTLKSQIRNPNLTSSSGNSNGSLALCGLSQGVEWDVLDAAMVLIGAAR